MPSTTSLFRESARRVLPYVPLHLKRNALYLRRTGRLIPRTPITFLEKIQWRILHDRRPLLAQGGDKLAMKRLAQRSCADVIVPETLWQGEDLGAVYDKDWGCEWVLKPVTGSGYVAFGSGSMLDSGLDLDAVSKWRHDDQFKVQGEWAYGQAAPGYFLERKIETPDGESPNDHRFFVFNGAVQVVQIDTPRFSKVLRRFYSPDWDPYDVRQGSAELAPVVPKPENLDKMLSIASAIGADFDFIRVDLYDVAGDIYFGEITPYPTGGLAKFSEESFDRWLGSIWELPSNHTQSAGQRF